MNFVTTRAFKWLAYAVILLACVVISHIIFHKMGKYDSDQVKLIRLLRDKIGDLEGRVSNLEADSLIQDVNLEHLQNGLNETREKIIEIEGTVDFHKSVVEVGFAMEFVKLLMMKQAEHVIRKREEGVQ